MILGVAVIIPTFYITFLQFPIAVSVDLTLAGIAAGLSIVLLILSSRLIRRKRCYHEEWKKRREGSMSQTKREIRRILVIFIK